MPLSRTWSKVPARTTINNKHTGQTDALRPLVETRSDSGPVSFAGEWS